MEQPGPECIASTQNADEEVIRPGPGSSIEPNRGCCAALGYSQAQVKRLEAGGVWLQKPV